jgi:predicted dehydrogenase
VVVAVPELGANPVSQECFQHPWAILFEKPVGYHLADAEEIASNARAHHARAYVALNRRHYSSTRDVLTDLQETPGPRFIHLQDQEDQIRALEAGQPRAVVENWMFANSIHLIDYFMIFCRGDVLSVEHVIPWDHENPSVVVAKVEFDSGDHGIYEAIWNAPGAWFASIHTSAKRWELKPLEKAFYQRAGQRNLESIESHAWDTDFKPGLRLQAQAAVGMIHGEETGLPTLEDALRSMRLVYEIYSG